MKRTGCLNVGADKDGGVKELSGVASGLLTCMGGGRSRQNHELPLRHAEREGSFPHSQT